MRKWTVLAMLLAATLVYGRAFVRSGSMTLAIPGGSQSVQDTALVMPSVNAKGLLGYVVLPRSTYTTGNFGAFDSGQVWLYTTMGAKRTLVDSAVFAQLPGTLWVNVQSDTMFLAQLWVAAFWRDSIAVAAGDTARTALTWTLKVTE